LTPSCKVTRRTYFSPKKLRISTTLPSLHISMAVSREGWWGEVLDDVDVDGEMGVDVAHFVAEALRGG
jgi:hypothetical protein